MPPQRSAVRACGWRVGPTLQHCLHQDLPRPRSVRQRQPQEALILDFPRLGRFGGPLVAGPPWLCRCVCEMCAYGVPVRNAYC